MDMTQAQREANKRYRATEKCRATWTRYNRSEKGKETERRYRSTFGAGVVKRMNESRPERALREKLRKQAGETHWPSRLRQQ